LAQSYKCPDCGGILDVDYDWSASLVEDVMRSARASVGGSMWVFQELLPVASDAVPVSLGEGLTPTIEAGHAPWGGKLWLKLEGANPTGSFKDRPVSVAVTRARELGVPGLITASSGNAGAAVAAYAARAGLPSVTLVPEGLPAGKLAQIGAPGTRLVAVRGNFSRAYELAQAWAVDSGWLNVTTTQLSAFPTEGNKTVAYELWLQLGHVPDWVLIPVSSGPLLVGALKGFQELMAAGLTDKLPRMVAVQAEGCAPIARAFRAGLTQVHEWRQPDTIATGIKDPLQGYADDGTRTLELARASGGAAVVVSDQEILAAVRGLAKEFGVLAEPTGAVGVAGLKAVAALNQDGPEADDTVVCMITGHGLKELGIIGGLVPPPPVIQPDLAALARALA
jgi:threonine synthase